jgi:pimeloyl-ACP methyl ester carboxylesterase
VASASRSSSQHRLFTLGAWLLALTPLAAHAADPGSQLAARAAQALESQSTTVRTHETTEQGWRWLQLELRDETYPLTVDLVGSTTAAAGKIAYLLPGASTNFEGSFFTPRDENIVQFLCENGYLVIGITPREDKVPTTLASYRFMQSWGMEKHSVDARAVVLQIQHALGLPYDVFGHSYGAATALDYAARYSNEDAPARVIVLDIYSLDIEADKAGQQSARRTYEAHAQLMERGTFVDTTYGSIKPVVALAKANPGLDSGVSRSNYGHSGSFTLEALLFSTLIDGAGADGIHTPMTGLPGDWLLNKSMVAGRYVFAEDPRADRYAFTRTSFPEFLAGIDVPGSGLVSVAFERDFWAVNAGDPGYALDWSAIRAELVWINSEYGYGPHRYGAKLIRAAGNTRITDSELRGYGHIDMLAGEPARLDLWSQLVP